MVAEKLEVFPDPSELPSAEDVRGIFADAQPAGSRVGFRRLLGLARPWTGASKLLCRPVLPAAERGERTITCSALALAKVSLYATSTGARPNSRARVVWDHKVKAKDGAPVATALLANVAVLQTFDKKLIARSPDEA